MKRRSLLLLAFSLLLVTGLGIGNIRPARADVDFAFTNRFVPVLGPPGTGGTRPIGSNIGIPTGAEAFGNLLVGVAPGSAASTFTFSAALNATGPVVTFFPTTFTLPDPLRTDPNNRNVTMTINVGANVLHGGYALTVTAADVGFSHTLNFLIKVYTIAMSIDASSLTTTDVAAQSAFSPASTFRVGFMVANATSIPAATNHFRCVTAFPCGLPLYGWEFTLIYDTAVLVPQGDPNPLATPGNPSGFYVDGAQNIVQYGGGSIGLGGSSWQSLVTSAGAFAAESFAPGKVSEGITLKAPTPIAYLTAASQLGSVSFELIQKPPSPSTTIVSLSLDPAETAFADQIAHNACVCVVGTAGVVPNNQGSTATETIINAPPTASFTVTQLPAGDSSCTTVYSVDTAGCSAYSFRFDASASSDDLAVTSYVWDFGDGARDSPAEATAVCPAPDADLNCSQGAIAVHDFAVGSIPAPPAKYQVTLRVTDASGATGSARNNGGNPIGNTQPSHATHAVAVSIPPTAAFTFTTSGQTVNLDASTSSVGAGQTNAISAYFWDFGDGSNSMVTSATTTHAYTSPGTFTVTLIVQDDVGANSTSTSHPVTIGVTAFTASFTVSSNPIVGSPVTFTASTSGGTAPFSYAWNFGDGATATVTTTVTTHTYTAKGSHTVTLTVTDSSTPTPKTATATPQAIAVAGTAPTVTFTVSTNPTVGSPVTFTATVTGGTTPYSYSWNFGDTSALGTTNPVTHTYTSKGSKTVTLTVTDANSATTPSSRTVNIAGTAPTVSFTVSANPAVGSPVTFTATVTGGTAPYSYSWSFGDGSAAGTTNPVSHSYTSKGAKTVTLTVTDANTMQGMSSQTVNIAGTPPTVSFTVSASPTVGSPVTFTATVTGGTTPYSFSWNFGDGSAAGTANPASHTYTTKGAKTATITVTDANTAQGTSSQTVNVAGLPLAVSFTVSANPTVGSPVTFTATVTGGTSPFSYSWDFGDGSAAGTTNPVSHTYTAKGSKTVALTVTDNNAAVKLSTQTVSIAGAPLSATFTVSANPSIGNPVTFTATVTGGTTPYSFSWNFGDGSALGTTNPVTHTYTSKGAETVTLTVTDANTATKQASQTVNVAGTSPTVSFTVSASPTVGSPVTFTATVTGGTTPYSYSWNFGDSSSPGTTNPVSHTYTSKGAKTVALTVTDANTATGTSSQTVNVAGLALSASFTVSANPTQGLPVTFTATVTGGTTPYSFSWSFGDGSPAGTTNPASHTYASSGSETVTLTVTDANSATAPSTQTISVAPPSTGLAVTFTVSANPTVGSPVTFTATVSGGTAPYSFSWDFGDGSAAGTTNPVTHTYSSKGAKTVALTVTDTASATAMSSQTVNVAGTALTASFTVSANPTVNSPVTFTATVAGGTTPYSYSWSFGDSSPLGTTNPVTHTYTTKGAKTVTLTVTDVNTATTTSSQTVNLAPLPLAASFTVSANPAVGSPVTFTATVAGGTSPYSYSWDFGDGSSAGTTNPATHTYTSGGLVTVALTVTDTNSITTVKSQGVNVASGVNTPPVASFTITPSPATTGVSVTFDASASSDPDGGTIVSYAWDFGDGTTGSGVVATHVYSAASSASGYVVRLTVTDSDGGATGTSTVNLIVTTAGAQQTDLTFQAFDCDDWEQGVGELDVLVNNQLVVNIPAGINHLTGTGDYAPYDNTWVSFGPFHITSLVTLGTNSLVFRNPLTSHGCMVRRILIVQGGTVFLNQPRVRFIDPTHPVRMTFSNPPLQLTSFTATPNPVVEGNRVTFTATFTGGVGPFTCKFNFGDDEDKNVNSTGQSCSVTHTYDDDMVFNATVRVRGVNTSDNVSGGLSVTVQEETDGGDPPGETSGVADANPAPCSAFQSSLGATGHNHRSNQRRLHPGPGILL